MLIERAPILRDIETYLEELAASCVPENIDENLSDEDVEDVRSAYLSFQNMLFSFRSRVRAAVNAENISEIIDPLSDDLKDVIDTDFMWFADRLANDWPSRRRRNSLSRFIPTRGGGDLTLRGRASGLLQALDRVPRQLILQMDESASELTSDRIRRILPDQQLSPVQFEISSNKIFVAPKKSHTSPFDRESALSARKALGDKGNELAAVLQGSNCDRRLIDCLSELNNKLTSGDDVILLGMANIEFSEMAGAFEPELPEAVNAMLRSHSIAVGMYAAQFPEWSRFVDNASKVNFDVKSLNQLHEIADKTSRSLNNNSKIADPQVSKVINYLNSFIENPAKATSKAGLAVLRTLENLVISIYRYGADFIEKTADKVSDKVSSVVAAGVSAAIIGIAVASASGISPIVTAIEGTSWISQATDLILKEIRNLN